MYFLRCSEFTSPAQQFSPLVHPTISDISFPSSDSLVYKLKRSKTNQSGPPQLIPIFSLASHLSPFEPIRDYVHSRLSLHASQHDPLFLTEYGQPASHTWFHLHFKRVLTSAGIAPEGFSAHSLRIGAASSAARQGLPDHVIKLLSRWSSTAYLTYIRTNSSDIRNPQASLASMPTRPR